MPELFGDQVVGVDWLKRSPDAILGDVPGLGKTAQVIRAAIELGARRIIVPCPAVARVNWERELVKWGWTDPIIRVTDKSHHRLPGPTKPQAVVLSYDGLAGSKQLRASVNSGWWDVLAMDEAHRLKSPGSRRTMAMYGAKVDGGKCLAGKAMNRWLVSGSIMPNDASELWTHLHALWPNLIPVPNTRGMALGFEDFVDRYLLTKPGQFDRKVIGYKDLEGLRQILDSIMLRRTKVEGLPELVVREDPYLVEVEQMERLLALEAHEEMDDLRAVLDSAVARDEGLEGIEDEYFHLATLRRLTGVLKAQPAADLIIGETPPGEKALVFGMHRECIERMVGQMELAGLQPAVVHGGVPDGFRNEEIDRFQNDPNCRVFVGQIQACQEAITLTAAHRIWVVEAPWSPEHLDQILRRAWRRGQLRTCFAQFVAIAGSIDERVATSSARKARNLALMYQNHGQ